MVSLPFFALFLSFASLVYTVPIATSDSYSRILSRNTVSLSASNPFEPGFSRPNTDNQAHEPAMVNSDAQTKNRNTDDRPYDKKPYRVYQPRQHFQPADYGNAKQSELAGGNTANNTTDTYSNAGSN